MKDSMVFYASWLDAIKNLPREMQGDVLTAIIEYGLYGETTAPLKPITKAMLALVKTQIDINNKRYENSLKGGRKRKEDNGGESEENQTQTNPEPKSNQTETKPKPNANQTQTNPEPNNVNDNDYDNDKEIVSTDVETVKKGTDVPKETHTPTPFENFQKWMKENTPSVLKLKNGITEEQYKKIRKEYSFDQLVSVLQSMENYKELTKKYTSAYLTFLKWAKRDYGNKT